MVNILNSSIVSKTNLPLVDLRYFSKLNIRDTFVDSQYAFQLKDMSELNVDKSKFNVKSLFVYSLDDAKIFITNTIIKAVEKIETAIRSLYNSKLILKNSEIIGFKNAVEYDILDNIEISKTKVYCKNKLANINFKKNNVVLKIIQKFVLNTKNIFIFKYIYRIIYLVSIKFYIFSADKNYTKAIYLRRGMLSDWIPGSSDIDYLTIVKNEVNLKRIYEINNRYKILRKIFPFYGENLIMTIKELNFYLLYGGIRSKNLSDAKKLYGENVIENKKKNVDFIKNKIDIVSEILNSYILFSNNYFFNENLTNDICFSKASIDILKYIDYFYTNNKPLNSRAEFINAYLKNCNVSEKQYFNQIVGVLKYNNNLPFDIKNEIVNIIFTKLDKLAKDFVNLLKDNVSLSVVSKNPEKITHSLFNTKLQEFNSKEIEVILFEDPGLCYVELENSNNKWSDLFLYYSEKIKNISIIHNTPVLFFTHNLFQMMILSKFQDTPLNIFKLSNLKNKYKSRLFYLKNIKEYYYY
jgi:hypothetical protein